MRPTGRKRVIGIALGLVALCAGAVWGGKHWLDRRAEQKLHGMLREGSPDQVRDALLSLDEADLRGAAEYLKDRPFSDFREIARGEGLTDEQRQRLRLVRNEARQARMDERVDEYFAAPKEKRLAVLDQHIDEMEGFWRRRRAERPDGDGRPDQDRPRGPREPRVRDRQEAKERMEAGNPDREKQRAHYRSQLHARMQARGMNIRRGPGSGAPGSRNAPGTPSSGRQRGSRGS